MRPLTIVSGGQTGVDRGALEAALELGRPHAGYCPKGRRAEDGEVPQQFLLLETASSGYPARTAANVRLGDGTLMLVHGRACLERSRGTKLTLDICLRQEKPWWVADPRAEEHVARVLAWIVEHDIQVLNVAGPRESSYPGIQQQAREFVKKLILGADSLEL